MHTAAGIAAYLGILKLSHMSVTSMKESPSKAASHFIVEHRPVLSASHVKELKDTGLVVIDNVLTAEELEKTRNEVIRMLDHTDEFQDDPNDNLKIRSDSVTWISEKFSNFHKSVTGGALMQTLRFLRAIPFELTSDHGFDQKDLGVPLANQLACYDGKGSNYVAHRDAPAEVGKIDWVLQPGVYDREFTMVLYLNDTTWDSTTADGDNCDGNLRCFLNTQNDDITGETATEVRNIAPIGGRLVIFDSKRVLHAVLPTSKRRIALTSWIGGSHSSYQWLRNLCIPYSEIDWEYLRKRLSFST